MRHLILNLLLSGEKRKYRKGGDGRHTPANPYARIRHSIV